MCCDTAAPIPTFVEDMSITDMDGDSIQEAVDSSVLLDRPEESHNGIAKTMFGPFAAIVLGKWFSFVSTKYALSSWFSASLAGKIVYCFYWSANN